MLSDYHIHTAFSDDSHYPMEQAVQDAISLGLEDICFTDHVDYGIKWDHGDPRGIRYRPGDVGEPEWVPATNADYPRYAAEIARLQAKYQNQIAIKLGLEFGIQTHTIEDYRRVFSQYPFDFIILSVHQIGDKELWNQNFQKQYSQEEGYRRYYQELLALVEQYHDYSVLGHLDLISRYDKQTVLPFENVRPLVTEILKTVIADGKGIEINTSSRRYGLSDLTPSREILTLYRELGGSILTIGSDCHKPIHLGAYLRETQKELLDLGFRYHCTYEGMVPQFHKLEG